MVGDGELRGDLEAQIGRLQLDSAVRMVGWRRDIPELLQIFDVFLLTSHWEGLPRVLLEAMALGVPIVATNVGGITEIVQTGENGYLASLGNIEEMAQRVLQLLGNEEMRLLTGEKVRQWWNLFPLKKWSKIIHVSICG